VVEQTTINYVYDPLYRLTEANYSDGLYFRYTYDAVGNRLTEKKCAILPCGTPITNTYTYDIANRLTSVNGQTYTWDNNGNLLNDGTSTYVYDAANRLVSVSNQSSVSSYQYNGLGDRVSQTVNSATTNYALDLNAGLTQVLADGTNTYLYGNGRIGELQPAGFAYHLGDALGSVRQLVDAGGGVTLARSYEPYGTTLPSGGTGSSVFAFAGEQTDSTGLSYNRARYYSPTLGRFFQQDSWGGDFNSPMTQHGYLYAYANPILYTDPSGHDPWWCDDQADPESCRQSYYNAIRPMVSSGSSSASTATATSTSSPTVTPTAACTPTQSIPIPSAPVLGAIDSNWEKAKSNYEAIRDRLKPEALEPDPVYGKRINATHLMAMVIDKELGSLYDRGSSILNQALAAVGNQYSSICKDCAHSVTSQIAWLTTIEGWYNRTPERILNNYVRFVDNGIAARVIAGTTYTGRGITWGNYKPSSALDLYEQQARSNQWLRATWIETWCKTSQAASAYQTECARYAGDHGMCQGVLDTGRESLVSFDRHSPESCRVFGALIPT